MTKAATTAFPFAGYAARTAVLGLCGAMALGLQACATTDMPQPKYPIYMQDKSPAQAPSPAPVAGATQDSVTPADTQPAISAPQSHGDIATNDLPPPPPPPPTVVAAPPVAATPAPVAQPVAAPAHDNGAAYVYVLQSHDTLYGVSRRFGVPVKTLYDINGLAPDATFKIGQRILLPATAADKGAEEHANGATMVKLNVAVASNGAPVAPARPVAATPVTTPPAKPPVTTAVAKPPVVAPPAKPPVTTTTTTTITSPSKPPVTTTTTTTTAPAKPAPSAASTAPAAPAGFPGNAQIAQMGRGMFAWPVRGKIIVPFGQLAPNVRNDGINIAADQGSDVVAAADGVVVYEGDQVKELGNTIYVKHPGGWYTGYSHLASMAVKNNEKVTKGEVIGTVGETGVIDRPQLHFEIRYTPSTDIARPIDPDLVLP